MTGAPTRVIVQAIIFLAICLAVLGGLGYTMWKSRASAERAKLPRWREIATLLGFLAVATQVAVLTSLWIWPQISRDNVSLGNWAHWALPAFVVAVPCTLAGKGAVRWWLLLSSVLLFSICFVIVMGA